MRTLVTDNGFKRRGSKIQATLEIGTGRMDIEGKRNPPQPGNLSFLPRGKGIKTTDLFENPEDIGLQKNENPTDGNPWKHGNSHGEPGIISPLVPVKVIKGKKIDPTGRIQNRNHHPSGDKPAPLLQMILRNLHPRKKSWK